MGQIVTQLDRLQPGDPSIVTIGAFDGVHLGHQYLISQTVARAQGLGRDSAVVTFDPRPQVILRPGSTELTVGPAKAALIEQLAPTTVVMLPFTRQLAEMPAEDFLLSIVEHLSPAELWVGADFAFGHNRTGDVGFLIKGGQAYGFAVHVVPRQEFHDVAVSSSHVRSLLAAGDVQRARSLLGRYPGFSGEVVHGFGRGVTLGYPTANVQPAPTQFLPATGIYAGFATAGGERLQAAISVGYNPVFKGEDIKVEAFLLDYEGALHGSHIDLQFVDRLRDEMNFESVDALVEQMGRDVARTRELLAAADTEAA